MTVPWEPLTGGKASDVKLLRLTSPFCRLLSMNFVFVSAPIGWSLFFASIGLSEEEEGREEGEGRREREREGRRERERGEREGGERESEGGEREGRREREREGRGRGRGEGRSGEGDEKVTKLNTDKQ